MIRAAAAFVAALAVNPLGAAEEGYGFDAAQFIQRVKGLLEHPALMFMDEGSARG